ncbi:hypothetical protein V5799_025009 [Amblyomma americanum]|uniref:Uncharacterized protein n=1 Tax=Amblyomma americanum TaxID=6943 RepID=A0AAQ4EAE5_AMBAM
MVPVLDCVLFGVLVAANLVLGLYYSLRKPTTGSTAIRAEVFLGSRALKMLPLAASSVASLASSPGLVGFPAHFYAYGWHMMWSTLTSLLLIRLATSVFVPLLYGLGVTSIFEVSLP